MDNNKLKISIKTLQEITSKTKEPNWYNAIRKKSMYETANLEFPKLHSMDLGTWYLVDFKAEELLKTVNEDFKKDDYASEVEFDSNSVVIVQRNNELVFVSVPEKYQEKIIVKNIFEAMNKEEKIRDVFTNIVAPQKNKVTSLHYTLLNAGVYIEVKDNAVIDIPVQYVVITEGDFSLYNHVALNVGKNAELNFIENYVSKENSKAFNIITEVLAKENSNINFSSVTNFAQGQRGTILRNGLTERNATLNWNVAAMDSADVFHDNTTNILGDGAESNLKLVTLGTNSQKTYFNSELINQGLNTNGDILQHGVLLDESHVVFNGVGFIVKGASGSNAYQSSRLLTLSEKTKADANPMLLIDENDVAAGHGASLGKIDEEQIYYLKSRGLSYQEASRLLVHGFLSPVIEQLKVEKVREKAVSLIDLKINKESR